MAFLAAAGGALGSWLAWASSPCCHPLTISSSARTQELCWIHTAEAAGNSLAFMYPNVDDLEHSAQEKLPRVSVVMPLNGVGDHNVSTWRTQVLSMYGGPLEFFLWWKTRRTQHMNRSRADGMIRSVDPPQGQMDIQLLVAGYSTICSQNIYNQLTGVDAMHKDSKYVFFLDDDVQLCPGTIGALVAHMIKYPEIFVMTGCPFDLTSGSLGSYCI